MPRAPFSYAEVGATKPGGPWPPGYHHFRLRRRIGAGRELFERAGREIRCYRMQRGIGIFHSASTPTAEPDTELTVRLGPIVAPCRVVYVLDEPDVRGFAYGTLPGHPEIGEELFAVEYFPDDAAVYGIVAAFSRPGAWYTRLGGPAVRVLQRLTAEAYLRTLPRR
ncbi:MAG: DUF1990 domain-containing protein [Mycobacteriaceae bacterium]|nr:DUF1990 domain-containing protein [Mycobacteriaceae bacterium]